MLSKHLSVTPKFNLIGSTFFGLAQNMIRDFQNVLIKLIVALSSTNATKKVQKPKKFPRNSLLLPRRQKFDLVQIESICRRQNRCNINDNFCL